MSSIIGEIIKVSIFGESHGTYIGGTIDGLPAGIKIDQEFMLDQLTKRKSFKTISTSREEKDNVEIISGVFNNYTTGTPLTILIKNEDVDSSNYELNKDIIRPGQVDYAQELKYQGFQDYRGGGHYSGRLTAPIVALGSIAINILSKKGIKIGSHIYSIHKIKDDLINFNNISEYIDSWNNMVFPVINEKKGQEMINAITQAKTNLDSLGGIVESVVLMDKYILGEPIFNSIESKLSAYLFSIGGVKGIEFGLGFAFQDKLGSEVSDEWNYDEGKVISKYNYNGGINGGISNLQPIIIRVVIKPTSSIGKGQNTINIKTKENVNLEIKGRHDPCIVSRVVVVINSLIALALLDLCAYRYGNTFLK